MSPDTIEELDRRERLAPDLARDYELSADQIRTLCGVAAA